MHAAHFTDWNDWRPLIKTAREKDVGLIAIKSVAKGPWEDQDVESHKYQTWYEPFDQAQEIEKSLRYTLSQEITTTVTPGELKLWPKVIEAGLRFKLLTEEEEQQVVSEVEQYPPLAFPEM